MIFHKSYWKWNEKYNTDNFIVGEVVENDVFNEDLEFDRESEEGEKCFKIKDISSIKICINHENKIVCKAFFRDEIQNIKIENLNIEGIFMKEVHDQLSELLIETDESYEGRKLKMVFGDWILGTAFLY